MENQTLTKKTASSEFTLNVSEENKKSKIKKTVVDIKDFNKSNMAVTNLYGTIVNGDHFVKSMHEKGLLVWTNSIIYDENDIINGYHSDDVSVADSPDKGWGWLIDKGFDIIQTDWCLMLKKYMEERNAE